MDNETYADADFAMNAPQTVEEFNAEFFPEDEPECSSNCEDPDCHLTHG